MCESMLKFFLITFFIFLCKNLKVRAKFAKFCAVAPTFDRTI